MSNPTGKGGVRFKRKAAGAGYSENTAHFIGAENLTKPNIAVPVGLALHGVFE